ncbi:MAG: hypothetical protein NT022_02910 [Deltaproteobacteria bacterium]|nr:hypothetical protein [Deltaproteobacteria bacterium]
MRFPAPALPPTSESSKFTGAGSGWSRKAKGRGARSASRCRDRQGKNAPDIVYADLCFACIKKKSIAEKSEGSGKLQYSTGTLQRIGLPAMG